MDNKRLNGSFVWQEFEKIALENGWIVSAEETAPWEQLPQSKLPVQKQVPVTNETYPWDQQSKMPEQSEGGYFLTPEQKKEQELERQKSYAPSLQTAPKPKYYRSPLVGQIQTVLTQLGFNPGKVDGVWGPNSARAWNAAAKQYGSFDLIDASGHRPPSQEMLKWVVEQWAPAFKTKSTQVSTQSAPQMAPGNVMKQHVPMASMSLELQKNAKEEGVISTNLNPKDKDFVGNPSKSPVGPFREESTEDYKDSVINDLIQKAHPKTVEVIDAMGDGGIVENIIEQQEKDIEIATNMPSGALVGIHAELIKELTKKADQLDVDGKTKEANRIDETLKKIALLPFDNGQTINKKAFLGLPALVWMGISALIGTGTAANLGWFSSIREDLATDVFDLYNILKESSASKWYPVGGKASKVAEHAASILQPFLGKFKNMQLVSEKDVENTLTLLNEFSPALTQIEQLVPRIKIELGESKWYEFGRDRITRIEAKLEDVKKSYKTTLSNLAPLKETGEKVVKEQEFQKQNFKTDVSGLQNLLVEKQLLDSKYKNNVLNPETINATKKLEAYLDEVLSSANIIQKGNFMNKIIDNNKLVMNVDNLRRIIELVPQVVAKGGE
jgi:hypothetical protein